MNSYGSPEGCTHKEHIKRQATKEEATAMINKELKKNGSRKVLRKSLETPKGRPEVFTLRAAQSEQVRHTKRTYKWYPGGKAKQKLKTTFTQKTTIYLRGSKESEGIQKKYLSVSAI